MPEEALARIKENGAEDEEHGKEETEKTRTQLALVKPVPVKTPPPERNEPPLKAWQENMVKRRERTTMERLATVLRGDSVGKRESAAGEHRQDIAEQTSNLKNKFCKDDAERNSASIAAQRRAEEIMCDHLNAEKKHYSHQERHQGNQPQSAMERNTLGLHEIPWRAQIVFELSFCRPE